MERSKKIIIPLAIVAVVGLAGSAAVAIAHDRYEDRHEAYATFIGFDGHHKYGGKMRKQVAMEMLKRFDTDGDNALTPDEVRAVRTEQFGVFDANGDGSMDLGEFQAFWTEQTRNRMVDRFQHLDEDGDGRISQEDFTERLARMIAMMDRNGDGKLDRQDRRKHHHDDD